MSCFQDIVGVCLVEWTERGRQKRAIEKGRRGIPAKRTRREGEARKSSSFPWNKKG